MFMEVKMNEKNHKMLACIAAVFVLVSGWIFGAVLCCRLGQAQRELGQLRDELESAHERYGDIAAIIERAGDTLSRGSGTINELRAQLGEVRAAYEAMAHLLHSSGDVRGDFDRPPGVEPE